MIYTVIERRWFQYEHHEARSINVLHQWEEVEYDRRVYLGHMVYSNVVIEFLVSRGLWREYDIEQGVMEILEEKGGDEIYE